MYLCIFLLIIAMPGIFYSGNKRRTAIFSFIAIASGSFFVPQTDLYDAFLTGVSYLQFEVIPLLYAGLTSIFLGPFVAMLHMALYYTYWKKNAKGDFLKLEDHYFSIGLGRRIWTYAINQEIIFRFGLVSILYFFTSSIVIAVLLSSIGFVWWTWHSLQRVPKTGARTFAIYVILSYGALGICTAYIFSLAGFLAALFVHLQFHLLWFPVQAFMRAQRNGTLES